MSTFLFDKTIFGPVKSRRLGVSLGIKLLPNSEKFCNFNCIYCECGWTHQGKIHEKFPSLIEVKNLLEARLIELKKLQQPLDVITFAGNGEPTMHPEFPEIIDATIDLRNNYFPKVKIAVLSNTSLVQKKEIFESLHKVDLNILKIDSAFEDTCKLLNKPLGHFNLNEIINNLKSFNGKLIVQTMFIKGIFEGIKFDNTSEDEITAWLEVIKKINPIQVMIYTIARSTPATGIEKIPLKKLKEIAEKLKLLGIKAGVYD